MTIMPKGDDRQRGAVADAALRGACVSLAGAGDCAPARAQVVDWPTERPPRPLPARDVSFPPYQIRTLPNGLQVVAVSHHEQPAVSLRLIVRAGGAQDPADKPGVAYLAAALLDQGTTTKSAEQIASAIDSIGGAIGAGAGSDLTFINAAVMKDSLGVGARSGVGSGAASGVRAAKRSIGSGSRFCRA